MRFLLDTNICIYAMKSRPESVTRCLAAARSSDLAISSVTVFELWHGVKRSRAVARNSEALRRKLTLVTHDTAAFKRIAGLKVVDWV